MRSNKMFFIIGAGVFLCSAILLSGCGDDVSASIPLISIEQQESGDEVEGTDAEKATEPKDTAQVEVTTETAEDTHQLPEEIRITISAAGDVTMGNYKDQPYDYTFRQTYEQIEDKSYFFANVADIFKEDDFTIVNLEGALTLAEEFTPGRTFNIKGDPEYALLLKNASVEAVSMGNNHRLDYGEDGSKDTVKALKAVDISYAYDQNTGICQVGEIQIGWVSVNEASQGNSVEKYLEEGIAKLKEDGADLIFACCHWGIERDNYPEDYQKELGRKCIDWGADLVIGHHPHVLQGIDQYQGKYIIYSLGNFCFGANRNPSDKDTMIFQQTFVFREQESQSEPGDEKEISYELVPEPDALIIPCSISSVPSRNNYQPTPLEGSDWQRVIGRINEYSKDFGVTVNEEGVLSYNTGAVRTKR